MATAVNKADGWITGDVSLDSTSFPIVKSDTVLLPTEINAIYVGGSGDVAYHNPQGVANKLVGCLVGVTYPLEAIRILSTGTSATNMVGIASKALR